MAFALVSEFNGLLANIDLCVPLTLDILLLLLAIDGPSVLLCNVFVLIEYLLDNRGAVGIAVGFTLCTFNSLLLMDAFAEKKLLGYKHGLVRILVLFAISSCGDEIASRRD